MEIGRIGTGQSSNRIFGQTLVFAAKNWGIRGFRFQNARSQNSRSIFFIYLNPTEACHTKAKSKNKTGITGKTSTIGLKTA